MPESFLNWHSVEMRSFANYAVHVEIMCTLDIFETNQRNEEFVARLYTPTAEVVVNMNLCACEITLCDTNYPKPLIVNFEKSQ